MRKFSPYLISPFLCTLSQRYQLRLAAFFFPNNMERSKKTATLLVIFAPQQKKQKDKKRYNFMTESLLSSNASNRFKFIVAPTRGKILWPPSQKSHYDSYLQENQELQTACSRKLYQVSLKSGQFTGSNGATFTGSNGVNTYLHLIKLHIVY